jgi:hypothetical protein
MPKTLSQETHTTGAMTPVHLRAYVWKAGYTRGVRECTDRPNSVQELVQTLQMHSQNTLAVAPVTAHS